LILAVFARTRRSLEKWCSRGQARTKGVARLQFLENGEAEPRLTSGGTAGQKTFRQKSGRPKREPHKREQDLNEDRVPRSWRCLREEWFLDLGGVCSKSGSSALPPDVRRGSASPSATRENGLCPSSGLRPINAWAKPRLTSGGTAEPKVFSGEVRRA